MGLLSGGLVKPAEGGEADRTASFVLLEDVALGLPVRSGGGGGRFTRWDELLDSSSDGAEEPPEGAGGTSRLGGLPPGSRGGAPLCPGAPRPLTPRVIPPEPAEVEWVRPPRSTRVLRPLPFAPLSLREGNEGGALSEGAAFSGGVATALGGDVEGAFWFF